MSSDIEDKKIVSQIDSNSCNIEKYPQGLRILAVDDNPVCLKLLSAVLKKCGYQFTATTQAIEAYEILKKNKDSYDLVLTDVKNSMDGFKLAELIDLEMDIPVILMSADDGTKSVMKGIKHGARDYIVKPIRYEELKIIWQHVARKDYLRRINPNQVPSKRHKDNIINEEKDEKKAQGNEEDKKLLPKKQRFKWTPEIHIKFVNVIEQLGREKAVPKKILEIMNEPALTRENVASHLQKYRKNWDNQEKMDKTMIQEQEKANKSLQILPSSIHQYHNRSTQRTVTDTNLISFGANIRAQATAPLNNSQIRPVGGQTSSTFVNNFYRNQHFGPKEEVNNFYSRPAKMENSYYGSYSGSSGGYYSTRDQPTTAQLLMPPRSSHGPIQTQSTQINQPTNSLPMLPSSSSYGLVRTTDSTHYATQGKPTNSLQVVPLGSSYGQLGRVNALVSKGKEKVNSFSFDTKELSIDSSNWEDIRLLEQILMSSDMECNYPFSSLGDDLVPEDDLVAMFNNNPGSSL